MLLSRIGSCWSPPHQEALTQAILVLTATWLAINLLPWTVLKAKPGYLFVCSDRPLTMHDPTPPFPWSAPAWESSPLVESTLPLGHEQGSGRWAQSGVRGGFR
jgi:hypothetical protein